jgi:hypothetical protein
MQQVTYEELQNELNLIFDYNPPKLSPSPRLTSRYPKLVPPPAFYDKHLDERYMLRQIVLMPSITADISNTVDKTLSSIHERKIRLPLEDVTSVFPTKNYRVASSFGKQVADAESVAQAYQVTTAAYCSLIASMLFLTPCAPRWNGVIYWNDVSGRTIQTEDGIEEHHSLQICDLPGNPAAHTYARYIPQDVWDSMESKTRDILRQVASKYPVLAVWEIYAISREADDALDDMGNVALLGNYNPDRCLTIGYSAPHSDLLQVPDATSTLWGALVSSLLETTSRSEPSERSNQPSESKTSAAQHSRVRRSVRAKDESNLKKPAVNAAVARKANRMPDTSHNSAKANDQWPDVTVTCQASPTAISLSKSLLQHV